MIKLPTNAWQHTDADGDVLPWYTESFLRELVTWDLKGKTVFEYGCGYSTLWYAKQCSKVVAVDNDADWANQVRDAAPENVEVLHRSDPSSYAQCIQGANAGDMLGMFDLVVIDGRWRHLCPAQAIHAVRTGGRIILDNAERPQDFDACMEVFRWNECRIYPQLNHPEWRTAYWKMDCFVSYDMSAEQAGADQVHRLGPHATPLRT